MTATKGTPPPAQSSAECGPDGTADKGIIVRILLMDQVRSRATRVLLAGAAAMFVAVGAQPAENAPPRQQGAATSDAGRERFDGYLFLDVEGQPLPVQSDAAIENLLAEGVVVSMKKIPVGVTLPRKTLLASGTLQFNAVFKDKDEKKKNVRDTTAGKKTFYLVWRDSYVYDIAAYHVDRLFGFERVPPVVPRKIKGKDGSLGIWLEGTITEKERLENGIDPPEVARFNQQKATMHLFDNLTANRDSNLGNALIDGNWRLWFIDCSRCFGTSKDLLYPEAITHCDRAVWKTLQAADRHAAEETLSPYLSGIEIDALFARRDKLVEHIQGLIDNLGEDLVLFDQRPPTERAPWADD
jgi:hypothetical protein